MDTRQTYVSDREPEPAGTGHVLYVDDEDSLRMLAKRSLEQRGYRVTTCSHATEAIRLYRESHDEIDLVILDMLMPGMTGLDALTAMRRSNPEIRAVLSSAYVPSPEADDVCLHGFVDFLPKPFETEGLAAMVARHLAAPTEVADEA